MNEGCLTAPALFANINPSGPHRCFYCGAACTDTNPSSIYVKDSFTGRNEVVAPGSQYVCDGCVACLQEKIQITTHDGKVRDGQRVRGYSWVLAGEGKRHSRTACTKADLAFLRDTCLSPPKPPFAIVLSDSGQKHLLYRGVVCWSQDPVTVTLELETITYRISDLEARIVLAKQLIAATGKPALSEPVGASLAIRTWDHHGDIAESLLGEWTAVWEQPLSRLAVWLAPNKELCAGEYPSISGLRDVPPKAGRARRSASVKAGDNGASRDQRDGDSFLFDLG